MNFRKLLLIAGAVTVLASCKKDEEETVMKPYLSGTLSFELESFILAGSEHKMTPTGITHPEGKGVGYYWKVTPGEDKSDTTRYENGLSKDGKESDGSLTYKFNDDLATYTVSCYAFAEGYSSSYVSAYVTAVKPGLDGSITGTGIKASDPKIEGTEYYYVEHNGLKWMRNNLANPECGVPYANSGAMSDILGRYYSYEEAVNACPDGWRLPTDQEWRELGKAINESETLAEAFELIPNVAAKLMCNVQFNSAEMWDYWPEVGEIENTSQMALIPAGYANLGEKDEESGEYSNATFTGIYDYAIFWTADKAGEKMAYYRYLYCKYPEMFAGKAHTETFGANVRCVK